MVTEYANQAIQAVLNGQIAFVNFFQQTILEPQEDIRLEFIFQNHLLKFFFQNQVIRGKIKISG